MATTEIHSSYRIKYAQVLIAWCSTAIFVSRRRWVKSRNINRLTDIHTHPMSISTKVFSAKRHSPNQFDISEMKASLYFVDIFYFSKCLAWWESTAVCFQLVSQKFSKFSIVPMHNECAKVWIIIDAIHLIFVLKFSVRLRRFR